MSNNRNRNFNENDGGFDYLLNSNIMGFYKSCEVTVVFISDKSNKDTYYNFYTIACFSEIDINASGEDRNPKRVYNELKKINDNYSLGIKRYRISIADSKDFFRNLQAKKYTISKDNIKLLNDLVLIPKAYVSKEIAHYPPIINKIIKPNYYGGSYIIEFFDNHKIIKDHFRKTELDIIYELIKNSPDFTIDISNVPDRIGNVIFQFPITNYSFEVVHVNKVEKKLEGVEVRLNCCDKIDENLGMQIIAKSSLDDVITDYKVMQCSFIDNNIEIELTDYNNLEIMVTFSDSGMIIYNESIDFIRSIPLHFTSHVGEKRIFNTSDEKVREINVGKAMTTVIGENKDYSHIDHILKRNAENQIINNSGDYKVLGTLKNDNVTKLEQRKAGLDFLRDKLLNHPEISQVSLWDPYLNIQDIIDLLFFQNTRALLRGITSLSNVTKRSSRSTPPWMNSNVIEEELFFNKHIINAGNMGFCKVKNETLTRARKIPNCCGINLDFRCQHNSHGTKFHDRFLIIELGVGELPIVYSLGTSVNSIGENHHLIQKVTNPRVILGNFNNLWDELIPERCRLLLLPNDLKEG